MSEFNETLKKMWGPENFKLKYESVLTEIGRLQARLAESEGKLAEVWKWAETAEISITSYKKLMEILDRRGPK